MQYLAPTGQLILAVMLYDEPFAHDQLIAFVLIWLGRAAFSVELAVQARLSQAQPKRPVM
ncbi:MAG: hypothetical protein H7138_18425 [Myxococcales bacterium]|nr:hypothetical protein [Myxococcales bacterium]